MKVIKEDLGDKVYRLKLFQDGLEVAMLKYLFDPAGGNKEVHLAYLGVKKRYQRQGFGSYLLREFIKVVARKHFQAKQVQAWPLSKGSLRLCDKVFGKRLQLKGNERSLPKLAPPCRYGQVSGRYVEVWYSIN